RMNGRGFLRMGAGVALLAIPVLAVAGRYQPEEKWLAAARAEQPFLPYRLGVVEYEGGASAEWLEYMGDLRAALRGSNYFQREDAPRLRLRIGRAAAVGDVNSESGCKTTPGSLAVTYRFLDGEQEVSQMTIETPAPMKGSSRSEEHTSELQSREKLVCRLLLEKKKITP